MRAVVQRVLRADVTVEGQVVGAIHEPGLLVLVGVTHGDTEVVADRLADKTWQLRILDGERSCAEVDAPLLVVSQFTLYADTRKGRRPSWSAAAPGTVSEPIVDAYVAALRQRGARVETGRFGAHMEVSLVNDGPLTLVLELDA
ncbi:MAG: D-tyrosyl-tRNA(Tyr) deacylase [Phenylobacterium zucineum]|nr:MAG: D-tyrosyl-tRNA(Tyr) deacylase [Phenylobacterium zucineum]